MSTLVLSIGSLSKHVAIEAILHYRLSIISIMNIVFPNDGESGGSPKNARHEGTP